MWHVRWKTLEHLLQYSSSPPVWHTAHKTSLESSSRAWCWSTCCSPPNERMWFGTLVLLWSCGLLGGCEGFWGLLSMLCGGVGILYPSTWTPIWCWSPVLSGRLSPWLACTWNSQQTMTDTFKCLAEFVYVYSMWGWRIVKQIGQIYIWNAQWTVTKVYFLLT